MLDFSTIFKRKQQHQEEEKNQHSLQINNTDVTNVNLMDRIDQMPNNESIKTIVDYVNSENINSPINPVNTVDPVNPVNSVNTVNSVNPPENGFHPDPNNVIDSATPPVNSVNSVTNESSNIHKSIIQFDEHPLNDKYLQGCNVLVTIAKKEEHEKNCEFKPVVCNFSDSEKVGA